MPADYPSPPLRKQAHLLESADLLEAAGSILTLEARHQSLLNVLNGGSFNPHSFDIQLTPQAVLALVGGFLTGCEAKDLGLTANQPLSVRSGDGTNVYRTGSQLIFEIVDVNIQIEVGLRAQGWVAWAATNADLPGLTLPVLEQTRRRSSAR